MIFNDLDKSTLSLITSTTHDVLLIDFVDERFNLLLTGRSLFSYSGELEKSGLEVGDRCQVAPDSDTFRALWLAGFDRFLSSVDPLKVVLNRAYWAERFPDGSDASSVGWIRRNNAMLQRLYDMVDQHWSLKCIDYPPGLAVADPQHRWGVAPYHYTRPFYAYAIQTLNELTAGSGIRSM
jgi:hypothetical protein